ncbi:MAG: speA [Deltaproteobacteria bacterium]|nr:speA [Deltaproteobacteria bacterium]
MHFAITRGEGRSNRPFLFDMIEVDDRQYKTPLFDALVSLAQSRKVSFHTPGHKSGKGIATRFVKFVGPKIFSIDLTTLDEVDSLQKPIGVIKEAQELAAMAYGAEASFFLINGTTAGNHAMVISVCDPGDKIIVARNAHKSVLTGLIFTGATPVFINPKVDKTLKLTMNVTFDDVKEVIDENPDAKAIYLTSPNYYGITADLERIIPYAHKRGIITLIDEAHGPHLKFHPELPTSALEAGADLCVQSTHKIIGGMTQSSMLHARKERVNINTLRNILKMVQSTSPSYILMASLDLARMQMATEGNKLLSRALELARKARKRINRIKGLSCFGKEILEEGEMGGLDETKLTITVKELGLSGYQVSQMLNHRFDIQVEMADPFHILVIVSIGDRQDHLDRLVKALRTIASENQGKESGPLDKFKLPIFKSRISLTPREAFFRKYRNVKIEDSAGEISSEIVTVYPPGIPILIPGEMITPEIRDYLIQICGFGATIDGLPVDDNSMISVLK